MNDTRKITFQQREAHEEAAAERLHRAEAGEEGEAIEQDVRFILNFEEYEDLDRLMRTSNLELIQAIATEHPDSIRETAAIVDRDYSDVHRNLSELESLGVIEFENDGQGKRPILCRGASNVDVSIQFPQSADDSEAREASA